MMTTMAAMLGGVPLMLGTGTGSEIRQPLGYAMVGGLIVSQALTLFTTPVVYLYLDRLSNAFAGWGRSADADHEAHPDAQARSSKRPSDIDEDARSEPVIPCATESGGHPIRRSLCEHAIQRPLEYWVARFARRAASSHAPGNDD